jgi:hypothetical protein
MVFGQATQIAHYSLGGLCPGINDTMWYASPWLLAKGIGVLHEEKFEGSFLDLKGAIVNGVQYGTLVGVDDPKNQLPAGYRLEQNFPNPFNGSTAIAYELPRASHVTLSVYDLLGRKIATVLDGPQTGGKHNVSFDANGFSSGVYIYRLSAGNFVETHMMTMMK